MMAKEWRELDWKWKAKYWKGRNKETGLNKEAFRGSGQEKGSRVREKVVEKFRKLKFLAGFEKPGEKEIKLPK